MNKERIKSFGQFLVIYTLIVIIWGAWVRISHSGDGCGDTWPLCRGQLIPEAVQKKTWIEYTHRVMSGLYGIFVLYLYLMCRKFFPKESNQRSFAFLTLIFMITEALLGAKLVLFGLVGSNSSLFRSFAMSLHQINSLLLMGSTAAFVSSYKLNDFIIAPISFFKSFLTKNNFLLALIIVAVTGAWAALSTTLFPSHSLLEGLKSDFSNDSPLILKIRFSHPVLALTLMSYFVIKFYKKSLTENQNAELKKLNLIISAVGAITIVIGILTLLLLSPTGMKLLHLALVHTLWILFIHHAVISFDSAKR